MFLVIIEMEAETEEMNTDAKNAVQSGEDVRTEENEVEDGEMKNQPKIRVRRQSIGLGGGWGLRFGGLTWTNRRGSFQGQINHGLGWRNGRITANPSAGFRWTNSRRNLEVWGNSGPRFRSPSIGLRWRFRK